MPRLLLALAALAAVAAVSSAAPSTEQLMERLLQNLEERHEAGPHGHSHGPMETKPPKPMATKPPMAEEGDKDRLKTKLMELKRAPPTYKRPGDFTDGRYYLLYMAYTVRVGMKVRMMEDIPVFRRRGVKPGVVGEVREVEKNRDYPAIGPMLLVAWPVGEIWVDAVFVEIIG